MSVTRLVQPKTRMHSLLLAMNVAFGVMCCIVIACRIVECTRNTQWHNSAALKCRMGYVVGSISVTRTYRLISLGLIFDLGFLSRQVDVLSDSGLVAFPLYILWRVNLPRRQRRMVLSVFATSILSSIIGICYPAFQMPPSQHNYSVPAHWARLVGLISHLRVRGRPNSSSCVIN